VILDDGVSPGETATPGGSDGIFRQNLDQRISELVIKRRNVIVSAHDPTPA